MMIRDALALEKDLSRLSTLGLDPEETARRLDRMEARIQASARLRRKRDATAPSPGYPENLPISSKKDVIVAAIREHPVVVITGETGSGKTTQLPKMCLEAGRGRAGIIGCTQPRRIAAVTVAQRIAFEMDEEPGKSVGYRVRFAKKEAALPYIRVMTDGILLAEVQADPALSAYDTIIVDEAHERSLNIDFVLGILKRLLEKRPDLRVVITSATLDTEKFSAAFGNAPIIEVSGRAFPVDVVWRPLEETEDAGEGDYTAGAAAAIDELFAKKRLDGDVLVFMPTESDVLETCELLSARSFPGCAVIPLFARLSAGEQARAFAPNTGPKIVVATNVAETSVTIPNIKYVVDTGLARIPWYSPKTRTLSLPVRRISRASADQRKGRCGRVRNGVCIRLFSQEDYEARPRFTPPEIQRANLADVILRMVSARLGDPLSFPFVDPPPEKAVKDGFAVLTELCAIGVNPEKGGDGVTYSGPVLTETGRVMARLPLDPRISRILVEARREGCLFQATVIAAALSVPDPRRRPLDREAEAAALHASFADPTSDFSTIINLWNRISAQEGQGRSNSRTRKYCKDNFLSFRHVKEWREVWEQIWGILHEEGLSPSERPEKGSVEPLAGPAFAALHRSVLSGYLSHIALLREKNRYLAARGKEVMLFPGSALFNRGGKWIMAAEMVETSRLYARTAANIEPGWIEPLASHLIKYRYSAPRFEASRGQVVADEEASLYGLPVVPKRMKPYARINPAEASEIFIRSALVEGEMRELPHFLDHNKKVVKKVLDMEERLRRRDIYAGDEAVFRFYADRLPLVCDTATLKRRIRERGGDAFLRLSLEDVTAKAPDSRELALFPGKLSLSGAEFPVRYRFEPGKPEDGVTVKVPAQLVDAVDPKSLEWLVPGLLTEKITALIKALPKQYRKRLVPARDTAAKLSADLTADDRKGSLTSALCRAAKARYGVDVPLAAFKDAEIADHLKTRVAATDSAGRLIKAGRDVNALSAELSSRTEKTGALLLAEARKKWEKENITTWDFGDLPEMTELSASGSERFFAFPALNAEPTGVALRLFSDMREARSRHAEGLSALYSIALKKELDLARKSLAVPPALKPATVFFGGAANLSQALYQSLLADLFNRPVRTREEFFAHLKKAEREIFPAAKRKMETVGAVLAALSGFSSQLSALRKKNAKNKGAAGFLDQMEKSAQKLVPADFATRHAPERLDQIPRHLKALAIRTERGLLDLLKDEAKTIQVTPFIKNLEEAESKLSGHESTEKMKALEEFFWMVKEFEISLFAPEIKTLFPVSPKRLAAAWEALTTLE